MKISRKLVLSTLVFFSLNLFCLLSCSLQAEQKSLTTQFDTIDALISQGQMKDALKDLKQTEKQAFDSWSYLGIYKRYDKLGESKLCEKILKKALKKNSSNLELQAVYTNYLLRNDRVDEAVKQGKNLQKTKYGSLYSEAILRQAQTKETQDFYKEEQFYQIYFDAYTGSKNPIWIRNCAVYNLTRGLYANAASLNPDSYADVDDAYFWAIVLYDAGKYYDAINALESSTKFLSDYQNKQLFKTTGIQIAAVQADSYMAISDVESAEKIRQGIVMNLDNLTPRKADNEILPILVVNSAIYASDKDMDEQCADLLFYAVNNWPDFVPALILYADFAYKSNQEREEDKEIEALRRNGIKTLEMERYDSRRKIPISDAIYRIDESIKRQPDPYLYIEKLDLKYKLDPDVSIKEKTKDLWQLLEDNYDESEKYKMLLVQYAVNYLLNQKLYSDAWQLFVKYTTEHCQIDQKRDFWEQFIEQSRLLDLSIVEFGGWFAADLQKTDEALRIYEYCVYESGGIMEDGVVSPLVSNAACMNLADLYFSLGFKEKALDLYGKTAGRESNNARRSEIFYRIACIYTAMGDIKNALRSVDYATSIYPENARASLLRDKITPIQ